MLPVSCFDRFSSDQDAHNDERQSGDDAEDESRDDPTQDLTTDGTDERDQGQGQAGTQKNWPWTSILAGLCDHRKLGLVAELGHKDQR